MKEIDQEQEQSFEEAFAEFANAPKDEESSVGINYENDGEDVGDALEHDGTEQSNEADEIDATENPDLAEGGGEGPIDLEAEVERLRSEAETWKHKFYSDAGRVGALQRKINELEAALQSASLSQPQEDAADGYETPPELAEFKEDYPEIFEGVERYVRAELERRTKQIEAELNQRFAPVNQMYEQQQTAAELAALSEAHPDWQEVAADEKFLEWLSVQPVPVQQMANSDYASEVSYVLDSYKTQTGYRQMQQRPAVSQLAEKRKKQLANASGVPSRGGASSTTLAEDDYHTAFAYYAAKKNK